MKIRDILLCVFFLFGLCTSLSGKNLTAIKFEVVNNVIILKVKTVSNLNLNIIFDSAANDFLLDSTLARKLDIINDSSHVFGTNFINGTVKSFFFSNKGIFKDSTLNSLYRRGNSINLMEWSKKCGVHVDGLIGVNNAFKKVVVGIDFKKNILTLTNDVMGIEKFGRLKKLKMIYTDGGYEITPNSAFHQLSACRIKLFLSKTHIIETNVQFDTGFNKSFSMLTNMNIDSLIGSLNKLYKIENNKKLSMGNRTNRLFNFLADTIVLDKSIKLSDVRVHVSNASKILLAGFGSLTTVCFVGMEFLKRFQRIYFDYINMDIYLVEDV